MWFDLWFDFVGNGCFGVVEDGRDAPVNIQFVQVSFCRRKVLVAEEVLDLKGRCLAGVFEARGHEMADAVGGKASDFGTGAQVVQKRDAPARIFPAPPSSSVQPNRAAPGG